MGKRRRRSSRDSFWMQQYGGMPVWGLAAASVLILGFGAIAVPAALSSPAPSVSSTPRPIPTMAGAVDEDEPEELGSVAFLGDSFSPAEGQPLVDYNFGVIASKTLGWGDVLPFGRGGTGYTNPGQAEEGDNVYIDRVPAIIEAAPDVVVVQGGTNDRDYDATLAAADEVFAALRDGLPDAKIIALGSLEGPGLSADELAAARDAISEAAAQHDVPFIDPIGNEWLGLDGTLFVDDIHPNAEGQRQNASLFIDAVETLP